ncbi:ribosome hibernation-promoting factor, HPF/YfiA family [Peloplasma aerotolerans]|jgi:putative sigma-54 modulation protein|uniref:Ribosome hibernation promoting factor n=1 Tax=Peloplasma aerotolerans TaxID=3044389 RepID=A0AAW6U4N4_9MOLU|nr:ribosome-associated translation inhibitor RaiA [Mariniplasma sp. M4Ah]MDI6452882.1 ribosome-associated translation inhibitor RaiA [Mariniplasma sp. M4Ah]MDR4968538.1 ribosome-associated translation inhibitor RaiA [Acholeplasmataceae bacterium]
MKFEVLGKNGFVPTKAIKDYAEKRFSKVVSFFGPEVISEVRVVCKVYKDHHKIEVTIPAKGQVLRAEVSDMDMYAAIDKANDKLVAQIRKHKDKLKKNLEKEGIKQAYSHEFDAESLEKDILASQLVKSKKVDLKPMSSEEAIAAMELSGHDFYVFLDKESSKTNVVYRRDDGDYAIIETQPL